MGSKVAKLLPFVADAVATATGNPELIPVIHGASTKLQGGSFGDSLKSAGLAFAGQEALPVLGNAFSGLAPETAASLGITGGGANSLTDLLGQTTGGASLTGAGTLGGDIQGIASGGASGNSTMLSRLLSGSGASAAPGTINGTSGFAAPSPLAYGSSSTNPVTQEFSQALGGAMPSSSGSLAPLAGNGISSAGIGGGSSSYGGMNTLAALGGAANSLNANDKAQKDLLAAQKNSMNVLQPYLASGSASNAKLSDLLGTSGNTSSSGYGTLGQPFTPGDLTQDLGYKFQQQQGDLALNRKAAATGSLNSGASLKAAEDYGQGLAGTTYNNAYQRYLQQQQQQYGMLAGQGGQGASAAGAAGNIFGQTGTAKANAGISSANITNQTLSSLLSGSGAKKPVNVGGQVYYI